MAHMPQLRAMLLGQDGRCHRVTFLGGTAQLGCPGRWQRATRSHPPVAPALLVVGGDHTEDSKLPCRYLQGRTSA